jgi:hypothetical protein
LVPSLLSSWGHRLWAWIDFFCVTCLLSTVSYFFPFHSDQFFVVCSTGSTARGRVLWPKRATHLRLAAVPIYILFRYRPGRGTVWIHSIPFYHHLTVPCLFSYNALVNLTQEFNERLDDTFLMRGYHAIIISPLGLYAKGICSSLINVCESNFETYNYLQATTFGNFHAGILRWLINLSYGDPSGRVPQTLCLRGFVIARLVSLLLDATRGPMAPRRLWLHPSNY